MAASKTNKSSTKEVTSKKSTKKTSKTKSKNPPLTMKALKDEITALAEIVKTLVKVDEPAEDVTQPVKETEDRYVPPVSEIEPLPEIPLPPIHVPEKEEKSDATLSSTWSGSLDGNVPEEGVKLSGRVVIPIFLILMLLIGLVLTVPGGESAKMEYLDVDVPESLLLEQPITLDIPGEQVSVYSIPNTLNWSYEDGTLTLRPVSRGIHAVSIAVIEDGTVFHNVYEFDSVPEGPDFSEVTRFVATTLRSMKSEYLTRVRGEDKNVCLEIAKVYEEVLNKGYGSLTSTLTAIQDGTRKILGFDVADDKTDSDFEAAWQTTVGLNGTIPGYLDNIKVETVDEAIALYRAIGEGFKEVGNGN